MNRRIRILSLVLVACFVLLFLQLNNWQVRQASSLTASPYQPNTTPSAWSRPRGEIVSADGHVLADSVPSKDPYAQQRRYPQGSLFADITGYYDQVDEAATGVEAEYDSYLSFHESKASSLSGLLTEHSGTDSISVTVSLKLQQAARAALHGEAGAVVAIDPRTGAILALYANPTFDPALLASHDAKAVQAAYKRLADAANPGASPLINGATAQTYPPGSTFKVVTTSAMFDHKPSLTEQVLPYLHALTIPDTNLPLHNFAGETCGGALQQILAFSCDTAYAQLGLELGAPNLIDEARSFGMTEQPPIDLPASEVAPSQFPNEHFLAGNVPFLAYAAIGQGNVTMTALQDALITAAIADHGKMMTPHVLAHVVTDQGALVKSYRPHLWRRATSRATADQVRHLMLGVTQIPGATAYGLFAPADNIAAKTGTAETGTSNCTANWFIATGPAGASQTPRVAVAAVVPYQAGQTCDATGAAVAGPVARAVLLAALGARS